MEKPKTKDAIREELDAQIAQYLQAGGHIDTIARGLSGRETNSLLNRRLYFTEGTKQKRTPVTDAVNAIDERRQTKKTTALPTPRPKKRIIYDDFGEPIREIWE